MKEGIVESEGEPVTSHDLEIPGRPEKEQKRGSICKLFTYESVSTTTLFLVL